MSNNFYGQFNTDQEIKKYFPEKKDGNCIEIGAVDGVSLSNTLHFEEIGWNVMCIEPIPSYFNYLENRRKLSLNFAITSENKDEIPFTVVTLDNGNKSAISGLQIDERLIHHHKNLGFNIYQEVINVKGRRLDWCIENFFNHDTIDFISIDTEGSELDVLKSFDIDKYNTKLLIIENNYSDIEIDLYLNQKGWVKDKRVGVNDFYIKNERIV